MHECKCVYVCVYICVCVCIHVCMCVYTFVYVYVCMCVNVCMCVYTFVYVCVHSCYLGGYLSIIRHMEQSFAGVCDLKTFHIDEAGCYVLAQDRQAGWYVLAPVCL